MTIIIKAIILLSIIGALMVSLNFPLMANMIWSFTNPVLAYHNNAIGQKEQALLFSIFAMIALFGVINQ